MNTGDLVGTINNDFSNLELNECYLIETNEGWFAGRLIYIPSCNAKESGIAVICTNNTYTVTGRFKYDDIISIQKL